MGHFKADKKEKLMKEISTIQKENIDESRRKTKYRYCPFCEKETVTQKDNIGIDYLILCCTCGHAWIVTDKEYSVLLRLKNKQEVDATLCAFLYFYNNATGNNNKLKIIAELHSELMKKNRLTAISWARQRSD